jgi:Ca2+-binding RTX toxin-like protein
VSTLTDQNWKITGVGDFDGDGKSDILWRNTDTGVNTIWKSGNSATSQSVSPLTNQDWKVVGVGDFDGDGKSDILWRNSSSGVNAIWKSGNGATVQAVNTLSDMNWNVVGTGDYDGDGKADILWRNSASGVNAIWKSANSATSQSLSPLANQDWVVLDGLESGDLLRGGAGANTLYGTINADLMYGAAGADTMTGGPGADLFRYLNATQGQDTITDFVPGLDRIQIVSAGFGGLGAGALNANNFVSGTAPTQAAPQFLYDSATGVLAFDADGTGGTAAVNLVTLIGQPALTVADLVAVGA